LPQFFQAGQTTRIIVASCLNHPTQDPKSVHGTDIDMSDKSIAQHVIDLYRPLGVIPSTPKDKTSEECFRSLSSILDFPVLDARIREEITPAEVETVVKFLNEGQYQHVFMGHLYLIFGRGDFMTPTEFFTKVLGWVETRSNTIDLAEFYLDEIVFYAVVTYANMKVYNRVPESRYATRKLLDSYKPIRKFVDTWDAHGDKLEFFFDRISNEWMKQESVVWAENPDKSPAAVIKWVLDCPKRVIFNGSSFWQRYLDRSIFIDAADHPRAIDIFKKLLKGGMTVMHSANGCKTLMQEHPQMFQYAFVYDRVMWRTPTVIRWLQSHYKGALDRPYTMTIVNNIRKDPGVILRMENFSTWLRVLVLGGFDMNLIVEIIAECTTSSNPGARESVIRLLHPFIRPEDLPTDPVVLDYINCVDLTMPERAEKIHQYLVTKV